MGKTLNAGFAVTLSGRWPKELPQERLRTYGAWLGENAGDVRLTKYEKLAADSASVDEAVSLFKSADVDIVIMLYGAFTGDDVSAAFAENLHVPVVLWAPYEPPFRADDRLYANALVAATMNAASLFRLGYEYHVIYGSKEDGRAAKKLLDLLCAYATVKKMRGTLFGLLGYRPTAFYNSAFDEGLIRRTFGVRMEETDLKVVFDRMGDIPPDEVSADMKKISAQYTIADLPDGHLENHSRLYFAMRQVIREQGYDFCSLKCWPEMGSLHATPCAVMGRLADEGIHIGCEGDVDAALAMVMEHYITGKPCFITDMINIDEDANTMTYWHCGNAAPSLMSPSCRPVLSNHPLAGQGTALYGTLKEGDVTVARFCNIRGVYKLYLLCGTAVATERNTRGVMVNVRMPLPVRDIVEKTIAYGVPHHYSLVWENAADRMTAAAKLLGVEVIKL